jgi:hypothetical protein
MNRWDVDEAAERFTDETPNLQRGARVLVRLVNWTDSNSDGWPYWQKPSNAASKLMEHLESAKRTYEPTDLTDAELTKALTPIKAFLTKQGVDHALILTEPEVVVAVNPFDEWRDIARAGLNNGSNDAEHEALTQLADLLGLKYNDETERYE